EFYRRQAALAIRQSWWARLADSLAGGGTPAWRYALAVAALVACTWGAYWLQTDPAGDPAISAAEITAGAALAGGNPLVTFVAAPGSGTWRPMPIDLPAEPEPVIPATVPLAPRASPAPASGQTPRYVLDRLPIVAASYDPARADF
ncbi:hypothetical protein HQ590_14410, partial [bacterium]|nr:hypothetical protein [bacterium]